MEEKVELVQLLHNQHNVPDLNLISKNVRNNCPVCYTHCKRVNICTYGTHIKYRHYKCRSCSKAFNDFIDTAVDIIKKLEQLH